MKTLSATLVTLAAAAAVSACGSGNSTTASSSAASPAPSPTSTSAASASGSASTTVPGTTTQTGSGSAGSGTYSTAATRRLGARAQHVLTQIAAATGQLATGNSSSEQRARATLAQAQTKADQLSATASAKLAATNPARPLIVNASRQAATTAGQLRTMKVTSQDRQTLKKTQASLSTLAGELGLVRLAPQRATMTQITGTLKSLAHDVTGTGSTG